MYAGIGHLPKHDPALRFRHVSLQDWSMRAPPYLTLLIQKIQDPHLGFDEVDAGLIVIEVNESPGDLLPHVLLLLQLEHMLQTHRHTGSVGHRARAEVSKLLETPAHHVELLLKLLISIVDAELFKTVDLKGLKPKEEEQDDGCGLRPRL